MRVKILPYAKRKLVEDKFPRFHKSESVNEMRKLHYGKNALFVKCGSYIYSVKSKPDIYHSEAL